MTVDETDHQEPAGAMSSLSRVSILMTGLIVGTALYLAFGVDFTARVVPARLAFALPAIVIWSTLAWFIARRSHRARDWGFYARVGLLPLIGVFVVTMLAYLLAWVLAGIWVESTWHRR